MLKNAIGKLHLKIKNQESWALWWFSQGNIEPLKKKS